MKWKEQCLTVLEKQPQGKTTLTHRTKKTDILLQLKKVFAVFHRQPGIMLEVAPKTSVLRSNICLHLAY